MKTAHLHQQTLRALLLALSLCGLAAHASAQVSWDRQAYGQKHYIPGHDGDEGWAYFYPNNSNWSQELTFAYDNSNPPKPLYETAPSNWSSDKYPRSGNVTLGNSGLGTGAQNSGTNLDRSVVTNGHGGVMMLNNLTIQSTGALNMEFGTQLFANFINLQGNNDNDATLTVGGGGGAWPVININASGTVKKTTGTSTFQLDEGIVLQLMNGGTIACDAGALQLSGNGTTYVGPVHFNAATGALIDVSTTNAVDSAVVRMTGLMTGINTGGTVRLSKGWLETVGSTGGATLNFGGDTFQWSGGSFVSQPADPFVNIGTINISGPVALRGVGFMNQGTITQSGAGQMNLPAGSGLTNTATGVIDLRNDIDWIGVGGGGAVGFLKSSGVLKKSAGSGKTTIENAVYVDNIGGTVEVDSGTLALGAGLVTDGGPGDGGTIIVAAGATLQLSDGTNTALYNGTYTGTGAGTVLLSGGGLEAVRFHSGVTFNLPPGMFQWTGGTIVTNGGAPFINAGDLTVTGAVHTYNYDSGFTNTGTLTQTGAGVVSSERNATTNGAGGTWDIRNNQGYSGSDLINAGTFQKSAGAGTSVIDCAFTNSGTINAAIGTLQFTNLIQSAGAIDLNGGKISSPNEIIVNGGSLVGSGVIAGSVRNNSGHVAPGHSPGKITINGNYTQAADGALDIEIGGPNPGSGYDQLVVNGAATLAGTLNISLINGYRPAVGDVFTILVPQSVSGTFATINASGLSVDTNYASGAITITVTSVPNLLLNISSRLGVLTADKALFGGFIIGGSAPKKVIVRAVGPSTGVEGALQDPTLELFDASGSIAKNDNWKENQQAAIEATGIAPKDDAEAAIVRSLKPGLYTAIVRGKNDTTGIGAVEVYDLDQHASSNLVNISSRGFVASGDSALIGGFIAGGLSGPSTTKVVVRALGPSLTDLGISDALNDPTLQLINANGSVVQENDNWEDSQKAALLALQIQPKKKAEAALIATLPAGGYTAVVRDKNNGTGVAVVEIYNVP